MKSAYELAMERLEQDDPLAALNEEQKAAIAEIDTKYRAKIAEREVFLRGKIEEAKAAGELTEAADGDGQLTREELRPPRPEGAEDAPRPEGREEGGQRPRRPHGPPPLIRAIDTDKDGVLSAAEITNAAELHRQQGDGHPGRRSPARFRPDTRPCSG